MTRKMRRKALWKVSLRFFLPLTVLLLQGDSWKPGTLESPSGGRGLASPNRGKTLTLRLLSEPETLDWNRAHTPLETHILCNLMEGLVSLDSSLKVSPALAESWRVSPDRKTYTFKIRSGVKWTDGVPLRAQDFVYSWKRLLSPTTAAAYAYFLFDIEGAKAFHQGKIQDFGKVGVTALDDLTLQVKLKDPLSTWLYIPTFWVTFPLRQDVVEKEGSQWERPGKSVTLGPYFLAQHDLESKIVLKANPNYYGLKGNVDEVVGLIVKDDSIALSLYESGKIDVLNDISPLDLERLKGRSDLKTFPYLKTSYLGMLPGQGPLSERKVRQAIAMAIDKSKIEGLFQGAQKAASSFVPPPLMGYSPKLGLPYDPEQARKELKLSGVPVNPPIRFELIVPNQDKPLMIAQFIQEELKKVLGIEVILQPFDNKTYRANLNLREYPLFLSSWSADYPDPDNFLSVFLSDSGNNRLGWKDPHYDRLVLKGRYPLNPQQSTRQVQVDLNLRTGREKLYFRAQEILVHEAAVIVPLYYEPNQILVHSRVKNIELSPVNDLKLRGVMLESETAGYKSSR